MVRNAFDDNNPLWAAQLNAVVNAPGSFVVVDGCTPTVGTGDWDIDIASGTVRVDGTGDVSVSAQTVDLSDPTGGMNAGETRVVLVTVDDTGTASDTQGTAATNPDSPDIPTDEVLVAVVIVAAADATVADSDVLDSRVIVNDGTNSGVNADFLRGNTPADLRPPTSASATASQSDVSGTGTVQSLDGDSGVFQSARLRSVAESGIIAETIVELVFDDATTTTLSVSASDDDVTNTFGVEDVPEHYQGKLIDTVNLNYDNDTGQTTNEWEVLTIGGFAPP